MLANQLNLCRIFRRFGDDLLNAAFGGFAEDMGCRCEAERHDILAATCHLGLPLGVGMRMVEGLSVQVCSQRPEHC